MENMSLCLGRPNAEGEIATTREPKSLQRTVIHWWNILVSPLGSDFLCDFIAASTTLVICGDETFLRSLWRFHFYTHFSRFARRLQSHTGGHRVRISPPP